MKLSKRREYAMRALIDLGLAHAAGRTHLPVSELARYERIPVRFLEQLLLVLKRAGLVTSRRGMHGGYSLSKQAHATSMGDVMRLMDGPIGPIACVARNTKVTCSCPDPDHCGLRLLMVDVRNAITSIVDRTTLSDVVEITLRKLRQSQVAIPFRSETGETEEGG